MNPPNPRVRWSKWVIGACTFAVITIVGAIITDGYIWARSKVGGVFAPEPQVYRILVPLYASDGEYLRYLNSGGRFPEGDYSRKVSKDIITTINATRDAWFREHPDLDKTRVEFHFFPEGYDSASYRQAFVQATTTTRSEVVAAIGHVTSSVTRAYGQLYGGEEIPLILPLATASNLPHYLTSTGDVPALLRLPPSNAAQAEMISDFLLRRSTGPTVLIARDLSNPAYSNDLVDNFRTYFTQLPFSTARQTATVQRAAFDPYAVNHGRIFAVFPTGGESGGPVLNPLLSRLQTDALLLFGMTEPSLEALVQMKRSGVQPGHVFFTDGAVDEYLLPRIRRLVADPAFPLPHAGQAIEKIYLPFPLDEPMPSALRQVVGEVANLDPRSLELTHSQYVSDAVQILLTVIFQDVERAREPGRTIVARVFRNWIRNRKIEDVKFLYDEGKIYHLDGDGNSTNLQYHLYSASAPAFSRWEHNRSQCPVNHISEQ